MPLSENAARSKDRSFSTPNLQHRHFAFIAGCIRGIPTPAARVEAARVFSNALYRSNPAYDAGRFQDACDCMCETWSTDELDRAIAHAAYWLDYLTGERTSRGLERLEAAE